MLNRIIPSTGEKLPVIGLGTWQTFDVTGTKKYAPLKDVLSIMKNEGGKLIDTSPMYGNAEKVIGDITSNSPAGDYFFYATKVWVNGKEEGIKQMQSSFAKMKRTVMDLIQVHNLTDWKTQLQTLREWKKEGKVRYIGITHYTDSMHDMLEQIISEEKIDFVQFNYSIASRQAEKKLLPAAAEHGVGTIINRPFGEGSLFSRVKNKPLPSWAQESGIRTWGQFFLAYIIGHPAVTCVIPANSNQEHARENFSLEKDFINYEALRKKMRDYYDNL